MEHRQKKKYPQTDLLTSMKQVWAQRPFSAWLLVGRQRWSELPKFHRYSLMVLVPATMLLTVIPLPPYNSTSESTDVSGSAVRKEISLDVKPAAVKPIAKPVVVVKPVEVNKNDTDTAADTRMKQSSAELVRSAWVSYTVTPGDTLSQVFRNSNLPLSDLNALIAKEGSDKPLSDIRPGQIVRYKLNKEGQLDILQLERGGESIMFFRLSEGGFGRSQ